MSANYTQTIGTITGSGKVHLAHGNGDRQNILCRFDAASEPTSHTIAEIPEDADVCVVLRANNVKMAHLCKNCFSIGLRKRLLATLRS